MKHAVFLVMVLTAALAQAQTSIQYTKHNLSMSGPGAIKSITETEICKFCHVPHNSSFQAPLWNREDPGGSYTMYWSATLDAYASPSSAPQPNGASKLCLSCHDGTIALGSTISSRTVSMSGGITTMPTSSTAYLGRDLSGDHPISFQVNSSMVLTNNAKGDVPLKGVHAMRSNHSVSLDSQDRVQCTSCHDPHDDSFGNFLAAATEEELCLACHF